MDKGSVRGVERLGKGTESDGNIVLLMVKRQEAMQTHRLSRLGRVLMEQQLEGLFC
jgi:hypothetical protein